MIRLLRRVWRHIGLILELSGYGAWLFVDLVAASSTRSGLSVVAGIVVPGVVLLRLLPRARLDRVAAAAIGLSVAISAVSLVMVLAGSTSELRLDLSFAEELALAILLIHVLRVLPLVQALVLTAAGALAVVGSPIARTDPRVIPVLALCAAMGWGGAVAIGLVLRELDTRRRATLDDVRSAERMELARELHDVVAHQVTGIIVAAQAASVVARRSPEEVDRALAAIEIAGSDALAAMRRMVGVLRGQASDGARTPGAELADLATLVERFDPDERLVTLTTDAGLEHAVLPAGVAATGYRVVQEALTNVRRHATAATVVEVVVRIRDEALHVAVRNDGTTTGPQVARGGSGGFGLVGMTERVAALDGELTAGPAGSGGWVVDARIPLRPRP